MTATEAAIETTATATAAYNAGHELSGGAVSLAWRNARNMVRAGYRWEPDGFFEEEAGCVVTPTENSYEVWLPGTYSNHPEGRCACPYFADHGVCKHLYFAVQAQAARRRACTSPAASWEATEEWENPNPKIELGM